MKTTDLEFDVQYYTWLSDLLTIFDLIRTNKHAEFTKDEVIEFTLKKNSPIAHFTTISDEVAIQFAEYLKDTNGGEIPIIRIEESPHKITQFSLDSVYLNIQQDPRNRKSFLHKRIIS